MNTKDIIYIAGYGRSGSTLLDSILSNVPQVEGLGEVSNLFDSIQQGDSCSCGSLLHQCSHWQDAYTVLESMDLVEIQKAHRKVEGLGIYTSNDKRLYRSFWERFLSKKFEHYAFLVDSSKVSRATLFRPLMLRKMGYNVTVVHLYKQSDQLLTSLLKGSNKDLAAGVARKGVNLHLFVLRSYLGAVFANTLTLILGKFFSDNYVKVDFDDVKKRPADVCSMLLGYPPLQATSNEFSKGHGVSGNRMRKNSGPIRIEETPQVENRAPYFYRLMFKTLSIFYR